MSEDASPERVTHAHVLAIAGPIVISNLSTPLLGLVDTAVIGQIPDASLIGAVALGATIFSFLYWSFGFLRMGTTGLTAQALGADDIDEVRTSLGRALIIAGIAGLALIALQYPIGKIALSLLSGSAEVEQHTAAYFSIRIWSAPFTLANFAILGWFIGRHKARTALVLQLLLNGMNLLLDVTFVVGFGWGVKGIAAGTTIAEIFAAITGLLIARAALNRMGGHWDRQKLMDADRIRRTILVNRDIMIRTLCLVFAFAWFMAKSADMGDVQLAANAVLMQFISTAAFFLDGYAYAAEALVGKAVGARTRERLSDAVRISTVWAASTAVVISLVIFTGGPWFIDLLTVAPQVREAARIFLPWAALTPLLAVWSFQLDGIFIGATCTVEMRNAMMATLALFLIAWWLLAPAYGNHGLWGAFMIFYLLRAGSLLYYYPRVTASAAPKPLTSR